MRESFLRARASFARDRSSPGGSGRAGRPRVFSAEGAGRRGILAS